MFSLLNLGPQGSQEEEQEHDEKEEAKLKLAEGGQPLYRVNVQLSIFSRGSLLPVAVDAFGFSGAVGTAFCLRVAVAACVAARAVETR